MYSFHKNIYTYYTYNYPYHLLQHLTNTNCLLLTLPLLMSHMMDKHGSITFTNDPLSPSLIKENLELLPYLVNLWLSTYNFDGVKETRVGPIHKALPTLWPILRALHRDNEVFKNFRPVSLLFFICKLTGRVVHTRINSYLYKTLLFSFSVKVWRMKTAYNRRNRRQMPTKGRY